VHDKELPSNNAFHYNPKQHFKSWIYRVTEKTKYNIPDWVINRIYTELYIAKVYDLNEVSYHRVNDILRRVAKTEKQFTPYFQHVYQITGMIRGKPLLTLSEGEEQKLLDMFDTIHESWERHKSVMRPERSNFMANLKILQMCFRILKYPENVIHMFSDLKGTDNSRDYDRICEIICAENGWKFESFLSLSGNKLTSGKTISSFLTNDN